MFFFFDDTEMNAPAKAKIKINNKEKILIEIKNYIKLKKETELKKKHRIKRNIEKKFIKPIFILGDKGVGKSYTIKNYVVKKLNETPGNKAFIVEANNLEELKDEIYMLSWKKDSFFIKKTINFLKTLRKERQNTIVILTIILTAFASLFSFSVIEVIENYYWLFGIFIFAFFLIGIVICFLYILTYPHSTKGKLTKSLEKISKQYNDKNEVYIFIDDLNRVQEKNEVYKMYKFIDSFYKNTKEDVSKIIIIYINEKEFFDKSKYENIKKYIGLEIFMNFNLQDFIRTYIKTSLHIIEKLKIRSDFIEPIYKKFGNYIESSSEKWHEGKICSSQWKLFINSIENNENKFIDVFAGQYDKFSNCIKIFFLKSCFGDVFADLVNDFDKDEELEKGHKFINKFITKIVNEWIYTESGININEKEMFKEYLLHNKNIFFEKEKDIDIEYIEKDIFEYFPKLEFFIFLVDKLFKNRENYYIFKYIENYNFSEIMKT